ncbi:Uu.00g065220.m01.CDS01 [Anthostomella pinea]|uniref:Uu.00g065220.m01.CDS01 n=1 Tax=Anthostomella pinea TaxID=933095 RepID=A0AAI8VTN9_9PEZI|nr:Uu.00g065220.m01.CDS01 [Anthostomella pinea]
MIRKIAFPSVCAQCARNSSVRPTTLGLDGLGKRYTTSVTKTQPSNDSNNDSKDAEDANTKSEPGPLTRRLEEATEEALLTGGRAGRRAVEDAGFSEELKERLFAKVKDAQFRSENATAFAEAGMPTSAGVGTRLAATSQPWTGEETTEDAVLRMLNDAHKPLNRELRGRPKLPDLQPVDMRIRQQPKVSAGHRAASARDKASVYAGLGMKELEKGLSDKEKEARRQHFCDRFQPAARAVPNTLTGLASLANERIEDAIARGQFKNIPRGKGVERDTRSDNPFVDTTEYIMNKMIKRQEIVPPWIEKQQEMAKAAHVFRARLRNDWKRHAARMISSEGGSLQQQMERARRYAKAEELHNPRKRNIDEVAVPTNSTDDIVMVKIRQQTGLESALAESEAKAGDETPASNELLPPPFRDPEWLSMEQSYMDLSINHLNTLTRSYNLMAPELAKKGYFSLERELKNCYADVAPLLADTIKDRASRPPKPLGEGIGDRPGSVLDRFGRGGHTAKVYDSRAPHYGFKEMWRDLFGKQAS